MTPLAHRIVKELTLPMKRRTLDDRAGLLPHMSNVHCFECTEIVPLVNECVASGRFETVQEQYREMRDTMFLPAPWTWLEWSMPVGRSAVLACEFRGDWVLFVAGQGSGTFGTDAAGKIMLPRNDRDDLYFENRPANPAVCRNAQTIFLQLLPFINAPRVITHHQRQPHKGLVKDLRRSGHAFDAKPWTEIKLEVNKPVEIDDGEPHESRISGKRAFHFCRKHIRIRRGRLEWVSAHWRGDAELGVRQARYKVTPGTAPAPSEDHRRHPN